MARTKEIKTERVNEVEYTRRDHLTITQKDIPSQTFEDVTFERSDIDNCQVNEVTFRNCIFDRSSLICLRVKGCVFEQCSFQNIDLISCEIADCRFQNCVFALATICDNLFFECQFEMIDFTGATLKENEFKNTIFTAISLRGSATSLNYFRHTTVKGSEFGNCTVDYNIVEDCNFYDSSLNIETPGAFFGLNFSNLHNCKILSLGEQLPDSDQEVLFANLRSQFEREGRYIDAFIVGVNQSLSNLIPGVMRLCMQLKEKLCAGGHFPSDQLLFLFNVFKELYRQKKLAYIALYHLRDGIREILESTSPDMKGYEKYVLLYNNLNLLHNSMMADLEVLADWDYFEQERNVTVCFKFKERPSKPIVEILEVCYVYVYGHRPDVRPRVLSEKNGSYIAVVQTTIFTLLAFRISTYLLVGSVKDLTKLRANASLLFAKKLPEKYYLAAIKPETSVTIPHAISILLTGLIKKIIPAPLKDLPIIGIDEDNLDEIQEVSDDDSSES